MTTLHSRQNTSGQNSASDSTSSLNNIKVFVTSTPEETYGNVENAGESSSSKGFLGLSRGFISLVRSVGADTTRPLTDVEIARMAFLWLEQRGEDMLYWCEETQEFVRWDSTRSRWRIGHGAGEAELLHQFIVWLRDEITDWLRTRQMDNAETGMKISSTHLGRLQTRYLTIQSLKRLVESYKHAQEHCISLEEFDQRDELLLVKDATFSGDPLIPGSDKSLTVNLRTGEIRESHRGDKLSLISNFYVNPKRVAAIISKARKEGGVASETFSHTRFFAVLTYLAQTEERMLFFRRMLGKWATGGNTQQTFDVFHGAPRTGKSTILDSFCELMGPELTQKLNAKIIIAAKGDKETYELGNVRGKRLLYVDEIRSGDYVDDQLIKEFTGSKRITVRQIYGKPISTRRMFNLVLSTNHIPFNPDSSNGLASRMVFMKGQGVKLPVEARNKDLMNQIVTEEADEFLAWVMLGAQDYIVNGLQLTQEAQGDCRANLMTMTSLGKFVEDFLEVAPEKCDDKIRKEYFVESSRLKEVYQAWERDMGGKRRGWGGVLANLKGLMGIEEIVKKINGKNIKGYEGARFKPRDLPEDTSGIEEI